jgi:hypothetical protein
VANAPLWYGRLIAGNAVCGQGWGIWELFVLYYFSVNLKLIYKVSQLLFKTIRVRRT